MAMFDWKPESISAGTYNVTFTATDDGNGTGTNKLTSIGRLRSALRAAAYPLGEASYAQRLVEKPSHNYWTLDYDMENDPAMLS